MKRQVRNDPLRDRLNNAPPSSVVDATDELMAYKQGGAVAPPPQIIEVEKQIEVQVPMIAIDADGAIPAGNFRLTKTGLEWNERATYEEWRDVGKALMRLGTSIQWVLGDWANLGDRSGWRAERASRHLVGVDSNALEQQVWNAVRPGQDLQREGEREDLQLRRGAAHGVTHERLAAWRGNLPDLFQGRPAWQLVRLRHPVF